MFTPIMPSICRSSQRCERQGTKRTLGPVGAMGAHPKQGDVHRTACMLKPTIDCHCRMRREMLYSTDASAGAAVLAMTCYSIMHVSMHSAVTCVPCCEHTQASPQSIA